MPHLFSPFQAYRIAAAFVLRLAREYVDERADLIWLENGMRLGRWSDEAESSDPAFVAKFLRLAGSEDLTPEAAFCVTSDFLGKLIEHPGTSKNVNFILAEMRNVCLAKAWNGPVYESWRQILTAFELREAFQARVWERLGLLARSEVSTAGAWILLSLKQHWSGSLQLMPPSRAEEPTVSPLIGVRYDTLEDIVDLVMPVRHFRVSYEESPDSRLGFDADQRSWLRLETSRLAMSADELVDRVLDDGFQRLFKLASLPSLIEALAHNGEERLDALVDSVSYEGGKILENVERLSICLRLQGKNDEAIALARRGLERSLALPLTRHVGIFQGLIELLTDSEAQPFEWPKV